MVGPSLAAGPLRRGRVAEYRGAMAACPQNTPALDWSACDTILLDMDGTILDLSFDNYFWRELVPRCLARERGRPHAHVREELFSTLR